MNKVLTKFCQDFVHEIFNAINLASADRQIQTKVHFYEWFK